ncbi:MAG: M48 family metalloprotease [Gammaproteobacteria bacterium]|nr:M48 family metalloprotease [Gammaproteobacteria bacterium]MDH3536014.1 M48 family metalloprotease [Gammaproteobacteria bacterium]
MKLLLRILLILGLALGPAVSSTASALDLGDLKKQLDKARQKIDENKQKIDQARGKVSTGEEIEIGGNLVSGLLGAAPLVDDASLQRYVNDVGFWVAAQSSRSELPWRFGVIDSQGINAFAAPGGYVVVTLGLFNLLDNEAQLAGVLAHEIAHVVRKHHLKALQKTMKREFWTSLTVKAVSDGEDRQKLNELVNAGVQLYATGLDREYEYDADLHGVVLAARAGYDPYALLDVLTTVDSINPDSEDLTVLMKTHPPTAERLGNLTRKMDGKMDAYASGRLNAGRFRQLAKRP